MFENKAEMLRQLDDLFARIKKLEGHKVVGVNATMLHMYEDKVRLAEERAQYYISQCAQKENENLELQHRIKRFEVDPGLYNPHDIADAKLRSENEALGAKVRVLSKRVLGLKTTIADKNADIDTLRKENVTFDDVCNARDSLQGRLDSCENARICLQRNYDRTEKARANAVAHADRQDEEIQRWRNTPLTQTVDRLEAENARLVDNTVSNEVYRVDIERRDAEIKVLHGANEYKKGEMNRLSLEHHDQKEEKERWRDRYLKKSNEYDMLRNNYNKLDTARDALVESYDKLRGELPQGEVYVLVYEYRKHMQLQVAGVFTSHQEVNKWLKLNKPVNDEATKVFIYTLDKGEL